MTTADPRVLLDTQIYSSLYSRSGRHHDDGRTGAWRALLVGRVVVIAFQTREEVLAGAYAAGWGELRLRTITAQLDRTPNISVDAAVVEQSAKLYAGCRRSGHPLHQTIHRADRWIAACALTQGAPLASEDGIFDDVPGLRRLRRDHP